MVDLSSAERRALRARAHRLHPVVMIGEAGLTAAVLREIDVALKSHELIKIRVLGEDRQQRRAWLDRIRESLGAAEVQQLGKLLVIYRPRPPADPAVSHPARPGARRRAKRGRRTKRSYQMQ